MDVEEERLLEDTNNGEPYVDLTSFAEKYGLTEDLPTLEKAAQWIQANDPSDVLGLSQGERAAIEAESTHKWHQPWSMYLCIVCTGFGAMGQGWAQTGINGANLYYPKLFGIGSSSPHDTLIVGLINSAIYLSNGLLGSWLVAPLNERFGRRGAVCIGAVISLVFNVTGSSVYNWKALLFCRLALGIGLAIITGTLNVFAAESTPAAIRGGLGVAWQLLCAFGIFLAFWTNMYIDSNLEIFGPMRWRMMLLAAAVPTLPLLGLIFFCPESPSWLIKNSEQYGRAYAFLSRLRNTKLQAARELVTVYLQRRKAVESTTKQSMLTSLVELFTVPRVRRATLAAYTTMLAQQLCGINIVAFYSSTIFVEANFSPYHAELASTVFGFVNFVGAIPAIWAMDSLGRRSLLLFTLLPMAMSMAVTGISFGLPDSSAQLRFGLSTSMIYLFCLLYSPGMGPVPAAYAAEVFPLSHRELGMSSAVAVTNLFATALSLTFPWLLSAFGTSGSFIIYGFLNVVAWALVYLFVPETKRRSLDELDEVFLVLSRAFIKERLLESASWTSRHILRR